MSRRAGDAPAVLSSRLEARRAEIEQAALARVYGIADPAEVSDPAYAEGLRAAVSAALDYGLEAIRRGDERAPPIPTTLLAQARVAARSGVSLDTVLRRYFAGYTLLGDFLIEEAEKGRLMRGAQLQRLLATQGTLLDRLLAAVGEEHARETESRPDSSEQWRAQLVDRLLAGERIDTSSLGYDFDCWHLGVIAAGREAESAVRDLAAACDCRLLLVKGAEGSVCAWLGSRRRLDPAELPRCNSLELAVPPAIALGEPGEGLAGWRLTSRQAKASLSIALRGRSGPVRYADVALVASMLQDDVLCTSLRDLYLKPLEDERDGGEAARQTLRAYFATDRNVSSTAASLGVNRNTVASRLRAIEDRLERPLGTCAADLEVALRIDALDRDSRGAGLQANR